MRNLFALFVAIVLAGKGFNMIEVLQAQVCSLVMRWLLLVLECLCFSAYLC